MSMALYRQHLVLVLLLAICTLLAVTFVVLGAVAHLNIFHMFFSWTPLLPNFQFPGR